MYPNLYFFLKEALGIEPWGFTQYINTFGLLVAIAFVVAAVILSKELKRREQSGLLSPMEETIVVGKNASKSELLFNLVFGSLSGIKYWAFSSMTARSTLRIIFFLRKAAL